MWSKGDRKGTICGKMVSNKLSEYCTTHMSQHRAKSKSAAATPKSSPDVVATASNRTPMVLRRNKSIDKIWHPSSGMVFVSASDKRVYSRYVDGALRDLKQEDIEVCKDLGFAFKKSPNVTEQPNVTEVTEPVKSRVYDTISEVEKLLG